MAEVKRASAVGNGFSFVGGVAGLVMYLVVALKASLMYGGAAGVSIVHGLGMAGPEASIASRLIIWIGMLLGALATAAIMIILGAVFGALLYGLVGPRKGGAGEGS
ncbi:MAG: hypothetical protein ACQEXJ_17960 [Myxococcota bacterium]